LHQSGGSLKGGGRKLPAAYLFPVIDFRGILSFLCGNANNYLFCSSLMTFSRFITSFAPRPK
jgi:hypothetical protein